MAPSLSLQPPFHGISFCLPSAPQLQPLSHGTECMLQASGALATSDDKFHFFSTEWMPMPMPMLRLNVTSSLVSLSLPLPWHAACYAPRDLNFCKPSQPPGIITVSMFHASHQAVSTSREKKIPFCSPLISPNLVRGQHKLGTQLFLINTKIVLEWIWDWSLKTDELLRAGSVRMSGEVEDEKLHFRGAQGLSESSHTLTCLHSQCLKMQNCPLASSCIIKAYYFEISQGKGSSKLRTEYIL